MTRHDDEAAVGDMLAAALAYVARGWCVLPLHELISGSCSCSRRAGCKTPAKHPRIDDWRNAASNDPEQVGTWWSRWPHANIGVLTGARSGLVVLDVDPRHGGDDALAAMLATTGPLPDGPIVLTGGGGVHYYFAHPGGVVRGSVIAPGLELKGDGQFVVAPPSGTGEPERTLDEALRDPKFFTDLADLGITFTEVVE